MQLFFLCQCLYTNPSSLSHSFCLILSLSPSLSLPFAGAFSSTYHPDWSVLAARIVVSDLHKQTLDSFAANAKLLHEHRHPKTGLPAPLIADDVYDIIQQNAARLDAAMHYERDFE